MVGASRIWPPSLQAVHTLRQNYGRLRYRAIDARVEQRNHLARPNTTLRRCSAALCGSVTTVRAACWIASQSSVARIIVLALQLHRTNLTMALHLRNIRLIRWLGALCSLVLAQAALAQGNFGPVVGTRDVLVLVAGYSDTVALPAGLTVADAPGRIDQRWEAEFQAQINPYFAELSRSSLASAPNFTFNFFAASRFSGPPQPIDLGYSEASTCPGGTNSVAPAGFPTLSCSNDPGVLSRDVKNALDAFDTNAPGLLGQQFRHVVVMILGDKRGRATAIPYSAIDPLRPHLRRPVYLQIAAIRAPLEDLLAPNCNRNTDLVVPRRTLTQGAINTVAHELGHQIGLPDLYNDRTLAAALSGVVSGYPKFQFTESWDLMGMQRQQDLTAFSRAYMGWLASPAMHPPISTTPPGGLVLTLAPPRRATPPASFEAVRVFTGPNLLQQGELMPHYMIESRAVTPHTSPDTQRAPPMQTCDPQDLGLPAGYQRGVLVSLTKPWAYGGNFFPLEPLRIQLRSATTSDGQPPDVSNADQEQQQFAVFRAQQGQDTFSDEEHGISVQVLAVLPDGSARIRVTAVPPPRPDLFSRHCWLDSPANGRGVFLLGTDPLGDGLSFGDPLFREVQTRWTWSPPAAPQPRTYVTTPQHALSCRIFNAGTAASAPARAQLYVLAPSLPVFAGPPTPASVAALSPVSQHQLSIPGLMPGASAVVSANVTPGGPFMALMLIDRAESPTGAGETQLAAINNWHLESFAVTVLIPGSPYPPLIQNLAVQNLGPHAGVLYASPGGDPAGTLPSGWIGDVRRSDAADLFAVLDRGGAAHYKLSAQPPDPGIEKPGVLRTPELVAWMDHGDSWIPAQKLELPVLLNYRTQLSVERATSKGHGSVRAQGTLKWRALDNTLKPARGQPVVVSMSCSRGAKRTWWPGSSGHTAIADARGRFFQVMDIRMSMGTCRVRAQFSGSKQLAPSNSNELAVSP